MSSVTHLGATSARPRHSAEAAPAYSVKTVKFPWFKHTFAG
jgi:hypothetical protein